MVLSSPAILMPTCLTSCLMHSMRNRMRSAPFFLAGDVMDDQIASGLRAFADDVPKVEATSRSRFHRLDTFDLGRSPSASRGCQPRRRPKNVGTSYYGQAVDQSAISLKVTCQTRLATSASAVSRTSAETLAYFLHYNSSSALSIAFLAVRPSSFGRCISIVLCSSRGWDRP